MSRVIQYAWKIFDIADATPKTLFHAVRGSRRLAVGKWILAEQKMVDDNGRKYLSGFHLYRSLADVRHWVERAKNLEGRVVCVVAFKGRRTKVHAKLPTILADAILIEPKAWEKRVSLKTLYYTNLLEPV